MLGVTYDRAAAITAILYIAKKVAKADFHRLMKLFYYADKMHLERYGRFIFNDQYKAHLKGPMALVTYNLLDAVRDNDGVVADGSFRIEETPGANIPFVVALKEPNLDFLSESEVECLDEVIALHGHKPFQVLTRESHDAAWHAGQSKPDWAMSIEDIARTTSDPAGLLAYLADPYP
jgi:hypothetical protein